MKLKNIIKNVKTVKTYGSLDIEITNLTSDSRNIKPSGLFFAIKGYALDGTKFIKSAIENGAISVVIDTTTDIQSLEIPSGITIVVVEDIRYSLGIFSCNFYDNPSQKLKVIGVTGTKGKTTSTYMIKSILEKSGHKVGLIGSIAIYIGDQKIEDCDRTSSESFKLFQTLDLMVKENVEIAIVEVSSQAMKLNRVTGCKFDAVLFTNLSEDHISPKEHANMEEYFQAKLSLSKLAPVVVTNIDNEYTKKLPELLPEKRVITFSLENEQSDIYANNLKPANSYIDFSLIMNGQSSDIHLSIPGEYMVYNALGAIGISQLFGAKFEDFQSGLSNFKVFGRSEVVPNKLGLTIIIDYAHTPASLESILKTVKPYTKGKVICTWGVGGDRDKAKRPIMGEISGTLADYTILTCDQPRTENPEDIMADIEVGIKKVGGNYTKIVNRTDAIRHAITMATKDDIIVLPGLGSDLYIEYMGVKYPYNERTVIAEIIDEIVGESQ
ncbi:MAG: UDP-N-acetylmuramoyl-L-alanyl-D-glutamate--2,6-diaminopimelate ligase [Clostridia bacterium]|nr:UDP-N-acetylmuramoyl-L-alanyl-D-glutamate--2,6-diaminopimelate ligase [Clostridia bacterium]